MRESGAELEILSPNAKLSLVLLVACVLYKKQT